jgi:hypothetical protein
LKEQLLGSSDRAALQSLVPLCGALGAGTIFALFFGGRRKRTGLAVFEIFAIAAVLTAVGTTAYFCIALLHQNKPISDHELTETATPLIVAAFLLIFVSIFSRLRGSVERVAAILPLAIAGAILAAFLTSSAWTAEPDNASLVALLILAVGVVMGGAAWALDRAHSNLDRGRELNHLKALAGSGYQPEERTLLLAIPVPSAGTDRAPVVSCWTRKGHTFLDSTGAILLRNAVSERWRALPGSEARPPVGAVILLEMKVRRSAFEPRRARSLRISTFTPANAAAAKVHELKPNDDGLFDVTELGLV